MKIFSEDNVYQFLLYFDKLYNSDNPAAVIQNWMRNRDVIEFLGLWESYNAVLINQANNQKERMELLRQLALQQLQTLETVSLNNLPKLGVEEIRR